MKNIVLLIILVVISANIRADVEICTIPLPVTKNPNVNKKMLGTTHVYIKINGQTYGMPYTVKRTYFGGDAYFYKEDPFYEDYGQDETCRKIKVADPDERAEFTRKIQCIANKISVPLNNIKELGTRDWFPIFDYHALQNNCASMVSYLLECAGKRRHLHYNYNVGTQVEMSKEAKIIYPDNDSLINRTVFSNYGEICEMAKDECE